MQHNITVRMERIIERLLIPRSDFFLVLLISLVLFLLTAFQSNLEFLAPLRILLGFAYVLFIPGYWLTAALFPQSEDLNGIERTVLSLGLSVALIPCLALILDRLPWGIRLWPILLIEFIFTFIFFALAIIRGTHIPIDRAYSPDFSWRPHDWWQSLAPSDKTIYRVIASAMIAVTIAVAWIIIFPSPEDFMTEFYMLGPASLAEGYPREADMSEAVGVTLGIVNRERGQQTYRVEVWVEDPWQPGRRERVAEANPITLTRGEKQEWPITWQMPWTGQAQEVELLLFSVNHPEPYRQLRFYLNVNP